MISKLVQRMDVLDNEHFQMKRKTKLILDMYEIIREIDMRLSTSNDCDLSALSAYAKKGEKLRENMLSIQGVREVKEAQRCKEAYPHPQVIPEPLFATQVKE